MFICVFCGRKNISVLFVYIRGQIVIVIVIVIVIYLRVFVFSKIKPCFRAALYQGAQNVIVL